jgi:hypothetical protein
MVSLIFQARDSHDATRLKMYFLYVFLEGSGKQMDIKNIKSSCSVAINYSI